MSSLPLTHSRGASYIMHSSFNNAKRKLGLFDSSNEWRTSFNLKTMIDGWNHLSVTSEIGSTKFFVNGASVGAVGQSVTLKTSAVGNFVGLIASFAPKLDDFRRFMTGTLSLRRLLLFTEMEMVTLEFTYRDFTPTFDNVPNFTSRSLSFIGHLMNLTEPKSEMDSGKSNHAVFDDNLTGQMRSTILEVEKTVLHHSMEIQTIVLRNDSGNFDLRGPFPSVLDENRGFCFAILIRWSIPDSHLRWIPDKAYAMIGSQVKGYGTILIPVDQWVPNFWIGWQ